ncbi:unnamed protein product [Effrenium voratum]|nr:unnamed protein product [Effrenium voratum]
MQDYDVVVSLLLLGEAGVGKSCIMQRFAHEPFREGYVPTIGMEFMAPCLPKYRAKVQIRDTAGNRRYRVAFGAFGGLFRGSRGVILIFDVSDRESFNNLRHFIRDVEDNSRKGEPLMLLILGNKADRAAFRVVSAEEALAFAESWNLRYLETSAKNNWNIQEAFEYMVEEVVWRLEAAGHRFLPGPRTSRTSRRRCWLLAWLAWLSSPCR